MRTRSFKGNTHSETSMMLYRAGYPMQAHQALTQGGPKQRRSGTAPVIARIISAIRDLAASAKRKAAHVNPPQSRADQTADLRP